MDIVPAEAYELYVSGRAAMQADDLERAVDLLRRSCDSSPHFKALELLGDCLMRLGRFSEAIVPLAAATTLNRGVRAPSLLARAFVTLGDVDAAQEMVDLALTRDPRNRAALDVREALTATRTAAVREAPHEP